MEDCSGLFENDSLNELLEYILRPIFALLSKGTSSAVKSHALNAINMLMWSQSTAIKKYMPDYAAYILAMYAEAETMELKMRIV